MSVDVVVFAGPVIVKQSFKTIPWRRETSIVPIEGAGSTYFSNLADSLRDTEGRILPTLLRHYVGRSRQDIGRLALCSFSAGWGLLNKVFANDADRAEIDACVLSDSAFGAGLHGHAKFAADAMDGKRLMVVTTTNNSANPAMGILKTARSTWLETQAEALQISGRSDLSRVDARPPMPEPSGGVWSAGKFFWFDYVRPGSPDNQGNDFSHGEHHDLAANAWAAYLVPYFAGEALGFPWKQLIGAAVGAAGLVAAVYLLRTTIWRT